MNIPRAIFIDKICSLLLQQCLQQSNSGVNWTTSMWYNIFVVFEHIYIYSSWMKSMIQIQNAKSRPLLSNLMDLTFNVKADMFVFKHHAVTGYLTNLPIWAPCHHAAPLRPVYGLFTTWGISFSALRVNPWSRVGPDDFCSKYPRISPNGTHECDVTGHW